MRVHDSQACKKMDATTRGHISHIFELRDMLLSFQTGFILVNAAVVCAVLESISHFEPSSAITEPRYLKLVTVCVDVTGVFCHQLGLLSTNLHAIGCGGFVETLY